MTHQGDSRWDRRQLAALESTLHQGSIEASQALRTWTSKPSVVEVDTVEMLPLEEATGLLMAGDEPLCFCSVAMTGLLGGELLLVFDDASGLALADMVLDQPLGTADAWNELTRSAALETANILSCAYLNSLARNYADLRVEHEHAAPAELLPSPPRFNRDFAESMLEFALMDQAMASDHVIVVRTRFEIDASPVHWTLLLVPDAASMSRLSELVPRDDPPE